MERSIDRSFDAVDDSAMRRVIIPRVASLVARCAMKIGTILAAMNIAFSSRMQWRQLHTIVLIEVRSIIGMYDSKGSSKNPDFLD